MTNRSIDLPPELVEEIDRGIGSDQLTAFVVESALEQLRRIRLQRILGSEEIFWHDADHPELAVLGTEGWIRSLREQNEDRLTRMEERGSEGHAAVESAA